MCIHIYINRNEKDYYGCISLSFSSIDKMSASFLRRHKQILINITSASGLLGLGDFCAQNFYEKKTSFDYKRFCMLLILIFV
jgi:hypothetical protein